MSAVLALGGRTYVEGAPSVPAVLTTPANPVISDPSQASTFSASSGTSAADAVWQFLGVTSCRDQEITTKFVFRKIDESIHNNKTLGWQDIKAYSELIDLVNSGTELIEQNKAVDVDLTTNDDILTDEIFWTDDRLKEIENYILPDLREYIEYSKPSGKKKIKKLKIKQLSIK